MNLEGAIINKEIIPSELIINYINSILSNIHQKKYVLDFYIVEKNLFLSSSYKEGASNIINNKIKLNIDIDDIGLLYLELYNLFKDKFIENEKIKVQVLKEVDFSNMENPYLSFRIHDIHQNEIDLNLRNLYNEKNALHTIENDLINLYSEKNTSRNR